MSDRKAAPTPPQGGHTEKCFCMWSTTRDESLGMVTISFNYSFTWQD